MEALLAGICARRRSNFLSLRRKKVTKERATLLRVTPALAHRGNLRCSIMECAAELTARWRAPFKQLRRVSSRSACVLRHTHHPLPCASRHAQKGTRAKQPHRPSLRSACMAQALRAANAGPSAAMARVDVRLFGCLAVGVFTPCWLRLRRGGCGVSGCAEGHIRLVD